MKILFITTRIPLPSSKGDQLVTYNRLRTLSKYHEITLFSFYGNVTERENLELIKSYCSSIHLVKLPKWMSYVNVAAKGLINNSPLQVLYYRSNKFKKALNDLIKTNQFDVIHVCLLRLAPYLKDITTPKVLELIDSMQLNLSRKLEIETFPMTLLYREELRRIKRMEEQLGNSFDQLIVVAEADRKLIPSDNVSVIPNGVDTTHFHPTGRVAGTTKVIFTGNMDYAPNIHAVMWFVNNCYEGILEQIPNMKLIIAGGNPPQKLKNISKQFPGTVVTGFVESIAQYLNNSSLSIAPMQSGSGMQNKILEAMACGLPVVSTSLGLGSIGATPGKEIIIANTPDAFIKAVVLLLQDDKHAQDIGLNAREYVVNNHSWEHSALEVNGIYRRISRKDTAS